MDDETEAMIREAESQSIYEQQAEEEEEPTTNHSTSAYLSTLNAQQLAAVTHSSSGGLQVLAGPGSGKTHTLTARIAYLISEYKMLPSQIVVLTFTNKASSEMKRRLEGLVGKEVAHQLKMGTFHSICVVYLRKYHKLIGLDAAFIIADRDDCLGILKRVIGEAKIPEEWRKECTAKNTLDSISRAKAKNVGWEKWRMDAQGNEDIKRRQRGIVMAQLYEEYENQMKSNSSLDFDDLLLYGLKLFNKHPGVVSEIKYVLIDEFQDTNNIQYQLVQLIAAGSGNLTIVGDPDQSIYGWRSAEVENLAKMVNDFQPCTQIFLENNYRSGGAILGAALCIVRQDKQRINKSLTATHSTGSSVVVHTALNAFDEAAYISAQIKHLVAYHGGLLDYNDITILLRYGALSRNIELCLSQAGIPSRMVGGSKFFSRVEVKDILSYLQLLENPSFAPALTRCLNRVRSVGEKLVRDIFRVGRERGESAFTICRKLSEGSGCVKVNDNQRRGIREFVVIVMKVTQEAQAGGAVSDLIDSLCLQMKYRAHLEANGPDWRERWENIVELKSFACIVADENPEGVAARDMLMSDDMDEETRREMGNDSGFEELAKTYDQGNSEREQVNPLRTFLAVSMLATDTETEDSKTDAKARKVTISTVHSFKGLESPVVFIPCVEEGIYPFYRSATEQKEIDEERRLLYVAITRAQGVCVMSHAFKRQLGAEQSKRNISPFLALAKKSHPALFVDKLQLIGKRARQELAKVLRREAVDEGIAAQTIAQHLSSLVPDPVQPNNPFRPSASSHSGSYDNNSTDYATRRNDASSYTAGLIKTWNDKSNRQMMPIPLNAGFSSALKVYKATPIITASSLISTAASTLPSTSSKASTSKLPLVSATQPRLSFKPVSNQSKLGFVRNPPIVTQQSEGTSAGIFVYQSVSVNLDPLSRSHSSGLARTLAAAIDASGEFDKVDPAAEDEEEEVVVAVLPNKLTTTTTGKGSLSTLPETRQSIIRDSIMLEPVIDANHIRPSLAKFEKVEREGLSAIKGLLEGEPNVKGIANRNGAGTNVKRAAAVSETGPRKRK